MKPMNNQSAGQGNPLGYAPIVRLIAKFAIPSIISMLVTSAYNITDQIFIGHVVGMYGNAATNHSTCGLRQNDITALCQVCNLLSFEL